MKSTFSTLIIGILLIGLIGFGSYYLLKKFKISASVESPPSVSIGDVNGDGKVDVLDLNNVVSVMNSNSYNKTADLNNDGKVDVLDLNNVISNYSK